MPNSLDANGLTTATQTELVENFSVGYQAIYGNDINLASDTPDGQQINLFTQAIVDEEDLLVQVYNSFDPDNAIGVSLDQRCAINGIQRQAGTFTITNITLVNSASVNLYGLDQLGVQPVYTIQDGAGNQWQLITTQLGVAAGTHVLAFQAAIPGAQLTTPNTITVQVTIALGVTSVNNPTTYTSLGLNEEADAVLRIRRQQSVFLSSQGYYRGLLAALENINGVTSAFIYENDTDATSTGSVPAGIPSGIPSHSIWVIVAGTPAPALGVAWDSTISYSYGQIVSFSGTNYISIQSSNLNNATSDTDWWGVYNPVAQAIYAKRNSGCGMKGATSYTITQVNGTPFIVYWDTVTSEDLFIRFTATSLNLINPPNIAAITAGLVTGFVPGVNAEVNINQLATAVQVIDPNTLVTSAGFSTASGGPYTNTLSPSLATKQFAVTEAKIIVLTLILNGAAGTTGIGYNINSSTGVVTNTTLSIANGGSTFEFAAVGGYGAYTYSVLSGAGSINSGTGVYTSSTAGTDVVRVSDSLSNVTTCVVTVT